MTAEPAVKPVEVKKEVEPEKPAAEKVVVSEPAKPVITAPSIPAAGTVWESVYFAFNSSWIEADDRVQLNRIVAELNRNPKMTIELRSYTDCRADDAYNQMLSEKRLAHVIDYIRARIHNPYRVRGLAMGELPTESGCDCESVETTCGDEVLQKSRRVDVIVMKK